MTKGGVFVADEPTGRERREDTRYRAVKLPGEVLTNVTENTILRSHLANPGGVLENAKREEKLKKIKKTERTSVFGLTDEIEDETMGQSS